MGRPKLKNPRVVVLRVRVTPKEMAAVRKEAKRVGKLFADWVRGELGLS